MGRTVKTITMIAIAAMFFAAVPASVEAQTVPVCANTPSGANLSPQTIGADQTEVAPITGESKITAKWKYVLETGSKTVEQIKINYVASSDKSWATVTLGSGSQFITIDPNSQTTEFDAQAEVTVTVSPDAPAFERANIQIVASAEEGTCVQAATNSPQTEQVTAGFYENYQARFQQSIWKTGQNERLQIPLIVQNFGNGPMRITFTIAEGTSNNLNFALPGPQTVESTRTGDTNELQIPIDVQTPFKNGYENRRDQLNLQLDGTYAYNTNIKAQPLQLQAVIQTQGVYVPGFEAVTMLGALLGAALLAMTRRE